MIIVGLGNPGVTYEGTRHNVGFDVLNAVQRAHPDTTWKKEFGVSWCRIHGHTLIKPEEFMNVSGTTLRSFMQKKGLSVTAPETLLVIHDDLDFPVGELKQQTDRSAGGHNGIQSIIEALGTQAFERLRIGIGNNRELGIPAEDYVLQHFTSAEAPIIKTAIQHATELIEARLQQSA
jgi:PTH1 family peptidyl-tRNA hydrolase